MKRKWKWTAVVLAVLLLGFGTALFLWPRDRITRESWEKIRIGMTEKEVEGILGGPGMNQEQYMVQWNQLTKTERISFDGSAFDRIGWQRQPKNEKIWLSRRGWLGIQLDQRAQVTGKAFYAIQSADPNFIDRIRDWLGW